MGQSCSSKDASINVKQQKRPSRTSNGSPSSVTGDLLATASASTFSKGASQPSNESKSEYVVVYDWKKVRALKSKSQSSAHGSLLDARGSCDTDEANQTPRSVVLASFNGSQNPFQTNSRRSDDSARRPGSRVQHERLESVAVTFPVEATASLRMTSSDKLVTGNESRCDPFLGIQSKESSANDRHFAIADTDNVDLAPPATDRTNRRPGWENAMEALIAVHTQNTTDETFDDLLQ